MLEHQRKRFKSTQKKALHNKSDHYFRKTSPYHVKGKNILQAKSYKRLQKITTLPEQTSQRETRSKQFSFLKFIPATTKHINERGQQGIKSVKQIKIPSFFKKSSYGKQTSLISSSVKPRQNKNLSFNFQQKNNITSLEQSIQSLHQASSFPQQQSVKYNKSCQSNEYSKLNGKIDYLLRKITSMKVVLDKKRQEKIHFMQGEKSERAGTIQGDGDVSTCCDSETPLKQFITQVPQHKDLHAFTQNPYSPRHSVYYVSEILRAYRQEKSLAREHILSSIEYLRMFRHTRMPSQRQIAHMKVTLPRVKGYEDKKTVILDLDETLIHCNENRFVPSDFKIKINFPTGEVIQVGINVRPFAKEILAALSKNFQVIVFTASHSCYANVVLDHLDPQRRYIHHRLFRESCYCTSEGIYVKDLRIINRPLQKMILVDNAAYSYAYQPLNGVPIIPYYEGKNDYELQALLKYIQGLMFSVDVREKNRATFKLDRYHQFDELNGLVEVLYVAGHG